MSFNFPLQVPRRRCRRGAGVLGRAPGILMLCAATAFGAATALPSPPPAWTERASACWEVLQSSSAPTAARSEALDILVDLAREHPLVLIPALPCLDHPDAGERRAALSAFSRAGCIDALPGIERALHDPEPAVVLAAVQAVGRLRPRESRAWLFAVLRTAAPRSADVRDAVAAALAESVSAGDLATAHRDADAPVRLVALHALASLGSPRCADFLDDPDPDIATAAVRFIYDEPIEPAWPALAAALETAPLPGPDGWLGRLLAANLHAGGPLEATRVAAVIDRLSDPADASVRDQVLQPLLDWDTPPAVDPVLHRPWSPRPRPAATAWPALARHAQDWLPSFTGSSRRALSQWLDQYADAPKTAAALTALMTAADHPEGVRIFRLRHWRDAGGDPAAVPAAAAAALTAANAPALRAEARQILFHARSGDAVPWLLRSLDGATAREKQAALRLIDRADTREASDYLLKLLSQARFDQVDPAVLPELIEAVERRTRREGPETRAFREALDAFQPTLHGAAIDPLRPWRPALQDGDPEAGRALFHSSLGRCTECHAQRTPGTPAAPDLADVGARLEPATLLERVTRPSVRRAGSDGAGGDVPSARSCRPMGTLLTLRELRDLLTYLRSRRG